MSDSDQEEPCFAEAFKGCVRIRIHKLKANDGMTVYVLEVSAWNTWAGQAKPLFLAGALTLEQAQVSFEAAKKEIRDYSWMEGDFVLEDSR